MSASLWVLLPVLPVVSVLLLEAWRHRLLPWLWLCALPPLTLAFWPPASLELRWLWPEARWGGSDLITRAWLVFTCLIWSAAGAFAARSLRRDPRCTRFWVFWQLSLCGNLVLIVAQDALSFYLGFSVMSLAAYGLIVHNKGPQPRRAGRIYLQLAVLGEMLLLAGLMLHVQAAKGLFDFAALRETPLAPTTTALLLVGLGIKAGFWPLHVWLPLAHPAAPAPASAVLSGAMIKAGVLGLWRFFPGGDALLQDWSAPLLALGFFTAFYGVFAGLVQNQAKTVLAFSSISQMGYALMILALAWRHPEHPEAIAAVLALFVVHHGCAKGALFLSAGVVKHGRIPKLAWVLTALPALAIAGLPLTSGGAAKYALKHAFAEGEFAHWVWVVQLGSMATLLLLARALWLLRRAQAKAPARPVPLLMLAPWALLCLVPLVAPWVWPLMRKPWLHGVQLPSLWASLWPLLLALLIAAVAIRFKWRLPERARHLPNPGLLLSLRLTRVQQHPPIPALTPEVKQHRWRRRERQWNRFWRSDIVAGSGWLICVLLLLGWLW